ncbi:hypothetical protein SAMN05446934_6488 [Paraburkholderia hospita]|nr:hypothetical protein SAMN05446934_6488 [Paraburkholderia hospita]
MRRSFGLPANELFRTIVVASIPSARPWTYPRQTESSTGSVHCSSQKFPGWDCANMMHGIPDKATRARRMVFFIPDARSHYTWIIGEADGEQQH